MQAVRTAALVIIAGVLLSNLIIDRAYPLFVLWKEGDDYLDAAQQCHEARSANTLIPAIAPSVDDRQIERLRQSAEVSLIACFRRDALRHELGSLGVSDQSLDAMDFAALRNARVDLSYRVSTSHQSDEQ